MRQRSREETAPPRRPSTKQGGRLREFDNDFEEEALTPALAVERSMERFRRKLDRMTQESGEKAARKAP